MEDPEFVEAMTRMHSVDMTKYDDPKLFSPDDLVTREQAAKFFVAYATNVLLQVIDTSRYCAFEDISDADPTLRNAILQSCLLRLFKGNQGKFAPTATLTKAQALAVIIRTLDGTLLDESGELRRQAYHARAVELGLTKETDALALDRPLTRYELALLLWRANKKTTF